MLKPLLAASGIYGILSYLTLRRAREMGLRLALGARPRDVVRLVIRQGLALISGGVVFGILGALATTRLLRRQLYEVSGADPASVLGVALLMAGIGLVSSYLPARRSAAIDPARLLRE